MAGILVPPFKLLSSTEVGFRSTGITNLSGNAGGLTIMGGTATTDTLTLESNPVDPLTSPIKLEAGFDFYPNGYTATSAPAKNIAQTGTYTLDFASAGFPSMITTTANAQFNQSASGFGAASLFVNQMTIQNVPSVTANLGPVYTLVASPRLESDGAAILQSGQYGFYDTTTFQTSNSGTLRTGLYQSMTNTPTISSGATLVTKRSVYMGTPTVTGTLINNIGINLANQNTGRNFNYVWLSGTGLFKHGDDLEIDSTSAGIVQHDSVDNRFRHTVHPYTGAMQVAQIAFSPFVDLDWAFVTDASSTNVGSVADLADVTQWNDRSTNGYDLKLGGGTDVPTWEDSVAALNNQPAVEFTSANSQSLEYTSPTAITAATTYTAIAVVSLKTVASIMRIMSANTTSTTRGFGITATPNWSTAMGGTVASGGTPATGTKYFVRVYATSAAHTIYVNEVSQATTATTASNLGQIVLGAGRTAVPAYANYLNGYIAFFGIYSGDITSNAQWANLKTYFNSTYGFTL